MDPDSFAVAVCRGEDQPAGFAGANPPNDKFCHGGVPVGGRRRVGYIALLTGVGAIPAFNLCNGSLAMV